MLAAIGGSALVDPHEPNVCLDKPDPKLEAIRADVPPIPGIVFVGGDRSGVVIGLCAEDLIPVTPELLHSGSANGPVGGWFESYPDSVDILQFLVYQPPEKADFEISYEGRSVVANFDPGTNSVCPEDRFPEEFQVIHCGWLVRGVWHSSITSAARPTLIDAIVNINGTVSVAYIYGFQLNRDGITIDVALPVWQTGDSVMLAIDTVQRDFELVEWEGSGVLDLTQS